MARTKKGTPTGGTIIYCRISQDPTGRAAGVERQERECRDLAERRGWTVDRVLVDNDLSATSGVLRPAFETLLRSDPERIIVWHTDRLVRLTRDLERVIDLEVNVHAVTAGDIDLSNPAGRAVGRTITAWATYEGEQKALRQAASNRQAREAGIVHWSQRPFGFHLDRTLHPEEAEVLRRGYELILEGAQTWVSLARFLRESGTTTSTGKEWTANTAAQVFRNPRNAGLLAQRRPGNTFEIIGKGRWPAIVSEDEFVAAQRMIGDASQRGKGQGTRKGLLSSIAHCGVCGDVMFRRHRGSKARGEARVYRCRRGHTSAPAPWLDRHVRNAVINFLTSPAGLLLFAFGDRDAQRAALVEAEGLRAKLESLSEAFAADEITRSQLSAGSAKVRARLAVAEAEAQRVVVETPLGRIDGPAAALDAWVAMEDAGDLEGRRAVILALIEDVVVARRRQGAAITESDVTIKWRPY